jgi:hypothetical protein
MFVCSVFSCSPCRHSRYRTSHTDPAGQPGGWLARSWRARTERRAAPTMARRLHARVRQRRALIIDPRPMPTQGHFARLAPARPGTSDDHIMGNASFRIDQTLEIVRVVMSLLDVWAGVRFDRLARGPQ